MQCNVFVSSDRLGAKKKTQKTTSQVKLADWLRQVNPDTINLLNTRTCLFPAATHAFATYSSAKWKRNTTTFYMSTDFLKRHWAGQNQNIRLLASLTITELQDVRAWRGHLHLTWSNLVQTGPPTASCPGPCPDAFWISPRMETSQSLCVTS